MVFWKLNSMCNTGSKTGKSQFPKGKFRWKVEINHVCIQYIIRYIFQCKLSLGVWIQHCWCYCQNLDNFFASYSDCLKASYFITVSIVDFKAANENANLIQRSHGTCLNVFREIH